MDSTVPSSHAIKHEQAAYIFNNIPLSITFQCAAALCTAYLFWIPAKTQALTCWLAAIVLLAAIHLLTWFLGKRSSWIGIAGGINLIGMAGLNMLWAWGVYLFFPPGHPQQALVIFMAIVLSGIFSTLSLGAYYAAFAASFLGLSIPLLCVLIFQADNNAAVTLALSLAIPGLLLFARRFNRLLLKSLHLRFENSALVVQLTEQKNIAEAATRDKLRLLAAASHDLHQPIHAQKLFLAVLSASALTDQQRDCVNRIESTALSSFAMLNSLLDYSRLEAGAVAPVCRFFSLQSVLSKIEYEFAHLASAKNLVFRLRDTTCEFETDPLLIELIVRNFVANAIRYTFTGGILLACRKRSGQWAIEVWDTGAGIAAENLTIIFNEFTRVVDTAQEAKDGLGLGLSIAKHLAGTLGHSIECSSQLGRGSVFRLMFRPKSNALPITG